MAHITALRPYSLTSDAPSLFSMSVWSRFIPGKSALKDECVFVSLNLGGRNLNPFEFVPTAVLFEGLGRRG